MTAGSKMALSLVRMKPLLSKWLAATLLPRYLYDSATHRANASRRWRRAAALPHLTAVLSMEPEIRDIESFVVVGVRERFDQATKQRIPALWQRFVPRIPEIVSRRPGATFGVCANANAKTGSFDYIAGVAVDSVEPVPEGLSAETIPRQTYAVFTHHVKSTSLHPELQATIRWIWGTWLPAAPYEYVPGPDFERYPPEFDAENGKGFLEICIPVRRKS